MRTVPRTTAVPDRQLGESARLFGLALASDPMADRRWEHLASVLPEQPADHVATGPSRGAWRRVRWGRAQAGDGLGASREGSTGLRSVMRGGVGPREEYQMSTMRWFPSRATPRGAPDPRRALSRRPVVLLLMALVALTETGCQTPLCGPCGPVATTWRGFRETVSRPFRRMRAAPMAAGACCPESGVEMAPLPFGTPAVVTPAPGATTTIPGPSESLPSALEPIPQATPGPPPSGTESTPSQGANKQPAGKASYEAYRPRFGDESARPDSVARKPTQGPAPTSRSAQGAHPSSAGRDDLDALDNLPPLELPKDLARGNVTPPVAPAAEREPTNRPALGSNAETPGGPAAPAPEALAAPGIRHFAGVESKLAGGSLPTSEGLDWLVEKGYRTVLDLREEKDISASFIADVSGRGLRYVALPVGLKTVDRAHVTRFETEIALADNRPLYFCDTDGTRPGLMWYIHRVSVDRVDAEVARRDAEEIGLHDEAFWAAAQSYLDAQKPGPAAPPAVAPNAAATKPGPAPEAVVPPAQAPGTPPAVKGTASPAQSPPPPTQPAGPAPGAAVRDPNAWRPLAAMLVTGFGVPLAYVSRAVVPTTLRALSRASLPAPRPSTRSLPGELGDRT